MTYPRLVARVELENDDKVASTMSNRETVQNIQVLFINISMRFHHNREAENTKTETSSSEP